MLTELSITQNAWKTGDPGLIFIDEINRKNPAKHLGEIETTNQCGEAPLLPYEGCVLGSINLNKFVDEENKEVLWDRLAETVKNAVRRWINKGGSVGAGFTPARVRP